MDSSAIPRCFYRVAVKALILDDAKRFLFTLENNGNWELPGGGLIFGENPHACLKREIKEEMGLEVLSIKSNPSYFVTAKEAGNRWWICNVIYETRVENLNFTTSYECVDLKFYTKEEALEEKLFPNALEFVKHYDPDRH